MSKHLEPSEQIASSPHREVYSDIGHPPLVSIIIPCYNAEDYVAEAIQSALDQDYAHAEIIVIDDGSTDHSLEVIKSFADKIHWESGPNQGGCHARNRGLHSSRGDYVVFLDADDLLMSEYVTTLIHYAANEKDDNVLWCCRLEMLNSDGEVFKPKAKWDLAYYDLSVMLKHGSPQTSAPLHNRENLLKIGGFDESRPCAQEADLHIHLASKLGITMKVCEKRLLQIRVLETSLSRCPSQNAGNRILVNDADIIYQRVYLEVCNHDLELSTSEVNALAEKLYSIYRRFSRKGLSDKDKFYSAAQSMGVIQPFQAYKNFTERLIVKLIGMKTYEQVRFRLKNLI